MSRYQDWVQRWLTWGGLVCAIAVGCAIAALNWFSIAVSFARTQDAGANSATAEIYAQRYAFAALMLLVIGLRLVDRPRRGDQPY